MSLIDACCSVCGDYLGSWITESGDILVVEPCKKGCLCTDENKFECDKDFEEEEDE